MDSTVLKISTVPFTGHGCTTTTPTRTSTLKSIQTTTEVAVAVAPPELLVGFNPVTKRRMLKCQFPWPLTAPPYRTLHTHWNKKTTSSRQSHPWTRLLQLQPRWPSRRVNVRVTVRWECVCRLGFIFVQHLRRFLGQLCHLEICFLSTLRQMPQRITNVSRFLGRFLQFQSFGTII